MPSLSDAPSQSEWASFFLQASIGTNLNHAFSSQPETVPNPSSSSSSLLRVVPESVTGLERFVREFYQGLGTATLFGISVLENGYCGLLASLLPGCPPSTLAWMVFARFSSSCKPVVLLRPILSIAGTSVDGPPRQCPWGNTVVDKVAPIMSSIVTPLLDTQVDDITDQNEQWVKELIKDMEEKWFGEWKFLLVGQSILHKSTSAHIPLILLLDMDIQILPWEGMGMLKWEDIYRMPSMSSILYAYSKSSKMPCIDPLDAYYQITLEENYFACKLENWLQSKHKLKGKKSEDPDNIKELFTVLQSHDLFIYYGHRNGKQEVFFGDHLQYLPKCSAALLMGCSSWILNLQGAYMPEGPPLNYLLAGSPVVIANLWNVTTRDASYYLILLYHALVSSRECKICTSSCGCEHYRNFGSLNGEVRKKFSSKNVISAAAVCYGVPTKISKKNA